MTADEQGSRWLERLGVLAILLAALLARSRDLFAPFDREFEGAQGAFFAIGAINYERLGIAKTGAYPVVNIDLGSREDEQRGLWGHPQSWYVYANHPPLVPLLAWSAVSLCAREDWKETWKDARPPRGIEPWIRAPFLAASLFSLLALWWAIRQAAGPRRALLALAIASALPISVVYGTLVNYENPALVCVLVAAGFFARWIRHERQRDLALCALAFALGSCVTFSGLFFVPPLALVAWSRLGIRRAMQFATAALAAGFAPVAMHAGWSGIAQEHLGLIPSPLFDRVRELWAPLVDGSHPLGEWTRMQVQRIGVWFTWPIALVAGAGLILGIAQAAKACTACRVEAKPHDRAVNLEPALLAGAGMFLVAFYRHTLDPQFTFLIPLVPAVAGLAALALDRAADGLAKLRAGVLPLVLVTCVLAVLALQRANDLRFDFRSRADESRADREAPRLPLPDVTGAELATLVPAGGFGIHPACVGLNLAVSFYAWRSLWAANSPSDPQPNVVAQRFGLGAAAHVLLLPKNPWPGIAASIREFEKLSVNGAPPDRESAHWRAWDLH